jgi:hypothetical protein
VIPTPMLNNSFHSSTNRSPQAIRCAVSRRLCHSAWPSGSSSRIASARPSAPAHVRRASPCLAGYHQRIQFEAARVALSNVSRAKDGCSRTSSASLVRKPRYYQVVHDINSGRWPPPEEIETTNVSSVRHIMRFPAMVRGTGQFSIPTGGFLLWVKIAGPCLPTSSPKRIEQGYAAGGKWRRLHWLIPVAEVVLT